MRLPSGYREVEYIESSGNQYINTGFKPNQNSRIVFDFFPVSIGQTHLFGSRSSNSSSDYFLTLCTGGYYRDDYASSKTVTNIVPSNRIIIDKNKNIVSFGSQKYTHPAATFTGVYPIALFASNTGGNVSYRTSIRLYSCKIYDDGVIVRDFIPCKNSSDIYGLYDTVDNQFYPSATSTPFLGGQIIKTLNIPVNVGGSWKDSDSVYVNIDGAWKEIEAAYVNIDDTWKELG